MHASLRPSSDWKSMPETLLVGPELADLQDSLGPWVNILPF